MTWQNIGQDNGKRFPTSAAPTAIGTKNPLTAERPAARPQGIIADGTTVPVQGFNFSAAGAALLFEQKSRVANSR